MYLPKTLARSARAFRPLSRSYVAESDVGVLGASGSPINTHLGFVAAISADASQPQVLNFYPQLQWPMRNWCWAAIGYSVRWYYAVWNQTAFPWSQWCEFGGQVLGVSACPPERDAAYDVDYRIDHALGNHYQSHTDVVDIAVIAGCISQYLPVIVQVAWPDGRRHFTIIVGFGATENGPYLVFEDPLFRRVTQHFNDFADWGYQPMGGIVGKWTATVFTKQF